MMIDTVLMCGNTGYDWQTHAPPQLNSIWERLLADIYFKGFEDKLKQVASTNVPYIVVAGHFPVWSIAEHGPTKCLLDKLRPLLHKYNVSAYFSGHDHNLQLITDTYLNHTVQYIVSGSANFVDESQAHKDSIPPNSLKFHWADNTKVINGGFNIVKANRNNMTITFVETDGKELYQTVIFPRA
jgi:tartrate-resistant acid phosphatase type 5